MELKGAWRAAQTRGQMRDGCMRRYRQGAAQRMRTGVTAGAGDGAGVQCVAQGTPTLCEGRASSASSASWARCAHARLAQAGDVQNVSGSLARTRRASVGQSGRARREGLTSPVPAGAGVSCCVQGLQRPAAAQRQAARTPAAFSRVLHPSLGAAPPLAHPSSCRLRISSTSTRSPSSPTFRR
jgi:hypothetical protein